MKRQSTAAWGSPYGAPVGCRRQTAALPPVERWRFRPWDPLTRRRRCASVPWQACHGGRCHGRRTCTGWRPCEPVRCMHRCCGSRTARVTEVLFDQLEQTLPEATWMWGSSSSHASVSKVEMWQLNMNHMSPWRHRCRETLPTRMERLSHRTRKRCFMPLAGSHFSSRVASLAHAHPTRTPHASRYVGPAIHYRSAGQHRGRQPDKTHPTKRHCSGQDRSSRRARRSSARWQSGPPLN
jgi:hypothetical protein